MKVIIVGYGEMMRSLVLGILDSKHEVIGVLRHDMIKKNKISRILNDYIKPSDDYLFLKSHSIKSIDVKSVNCNKFHKIIKKLKADVVIVGSWSEKFSVQTLNVLPNGFINVHPSLLPKYRGPNPYLQVILRNEQFSGITFHLMDVNYDTGSILHQKQVDVLPDDTGGSLKLRCCDKAKNEIAFLLDNYKERVLNQRSQVETEATYQPQISAGFSVINFQKETASFIDRKIRALNPWLKCIIPIKGEFFTFENYEITTNKSDKKAATIVDKQGDTIYVVCKDLTIMKFSGLKINSPFSKFLSQIYLDKIIKINERAV